MSTTDSNNDCIVYVTGRKGNIKKVRYDEITDRLEMLAKGQFVSPPLPELSNIVPEIVTHKVSEEIKRHNYIPTWQIDEIAAIQCNFLYYLHPDYYSLSDRIIVADLHKRIRTSFSESMLCIHLQTLDTTKPYDPSKKGYLHPLFMEYVLKHRKELDDIVRPERDYLLTYFGVKTLKSGYLLTVRKENLDKSLTEHLYTDDVIMETPQYTFLRVAVALNLGNLQAIKESYEATSLGYYTHASPTMFHAGTNRQQLSSCFVAGTLVHTDEGPKPIEAVKLGDKVLTHKGNWKPVTQLHKNPLAGRTIYRLKCDFTEEIQVTGNHEAWCVTPDNLTPRWVRVDQMENPTYIALPKKKEEPFEQILDVWTILPKIEFECSLQFHVDDKEIGSSRVWSRPGPNNDKMTCSKKLATIKRFWNINEDFAKFVGIWIGDGHICKQRNSKRVQKISGIGITQDHRNIAMNEFVTKYIINTFGVKPYHNKMKKQNTLQIVVNSAIVGEVFNYLFGQGFAGKHLHPMMYHWNENMIKNLVIGLMSSDGCMRTRGDFVMGFSNKPLCEQVYFLSRSVSQPMNFYKKNKRHALATCDHFSIDPPKNWFKGSDLLKYYPDQRNAPINDLDIEETNEKNELTSYKRVKRAGGCQFLPFILVDGVTFTRVHKERETLAGPLPEYVYTLGVEDDHSYCAGGLIFRNCFLTIIKDDSIIGIFDSLKETALISQSAGGIGIDLTPLREEGARISTSNGVSSGLRHILTLFNNMAEYVDQGGGKRKGAIAAYLEPWHPDIFTFLTARTQSGMHLTMNIALWIPDEFMRRVQEDEEWSLISPTVCPDLMQKYGAEFDALYQSLEKDPANVRRKVPARELFTKILESIIETGQPYILFKDAANSKSNQKNLGTIRCSNLCSEIIEYVSKDEVAVCNLGSVALNKFISSSNNEYDHQKLYEITRLAIRNLNTVIDINYYPVNEAKTSNKKHRPVGLGVQGLADLFASLNLPFDSKEARKLNKEIFETMYFAALTESCEIAKRDGPYESYKGSPMSEGRFQFDLWEDFDPKKDFSGRWDWQKLKKQVSKYGVRNSLLLTCMPTASTSHILGNVECMEPPTSMIFAHNVKTGTFAVINKNLAKVLANLNLWNASVINQILDKDNRGSIQQIDGISKEIKKVYRTSFEISPSSLIEMAADRGRFICQSQSLNYFLPTSKVSKLAGHIFEAWKKGLKTGMYYCYWLTRDKAMNVTVGDHSAAKRKHESDESDESDSEQPVKKQDVDVIEDEDASASASCFVKNGADCTSCSG